MFDKILIANRGEIALRVIRACRELGITTVAVYSEADRYALHVKHADVAYCLGPESLAAYLNAARLVNLAKSCGCDAIHPGYGFLSENAEFADLCKNSGIVFIGPNAQVMRQMGDKVAARAQMRQAGVPIVPGSDSNLENLDAAIECAAQIGYPIMLKATTGGGGRGLRICDSERSLRSNYERVISEAEKSFSTPAVFIEKYIQNARHIEVQILADKHANVVHLFERDCSIQRRHQKLIEVAPSPQITEQQREYVCQLACRATSEVGYDSVGTVEFVLEDNKNFYFLEMNTRLQVEHPVTEMITGIDIVAEQIHIAYGDKLSFKQADIKLNGSAIEFRINAEDPQQDFLPSFGKISRYYAPGGPGVRTDSAIYTGYTIPSDYDSLCAKLIVWHHDWPSMCERARRALSEMRMHGIKTTIPYYLAILEDADFINAHFNTRFVELHNKLLQYSIKPSQLHRVTAIAAVFSAYFSSTFGPGGSS